MTRHIACRAEAREAFTRAKAGGFVLSFVVATAALAAQSRGLDPAELLKPLADQWSSYSGDYTGRRYSALTQINQATITNVTLAWTTRFSGAAPSSGPPAPGAPPVTIGGEGSGDVVIGGAVALKGAILAV